jgi:hypothetical protein
MLRGKSTQAARNSQGRWTLEVEMDTPRQANVRMMRIRRQEQMPDSARRKSAPGSSVRLSSFDSSLSASGTNVAQPEPAGT